MRFKYIYRLIIVIIYEDNQLSIGKQKKTDKKGIVRSPEYGWLSFTLPRFKEFISILMTPPCLRIMRYSSRELLSLSPRSARRRGKCTEITEWNRLLIINECNSALIELRI